MTPYTFAADFERAVAALLCTSTRFFALVGPHLDPTRLANPHARLLATHARLVYDESGKGPGSAALAVQRLRRTHEQGKITLDAMIAATEYLCDAQDAGVPDVDLAVAEVRDVLQREAHRKAITTAAETFANRGSMLDVAKEIERAESIGREDATTGIELDDLQQALIDGGTIERFPTGILELDAATGGGLARGEFAFWLAAAKAGKSHALVQNAVIGVRNRLNVAAVTLELAPEKWMARAIAGITGTPVNDIIADPANSVAFKRYAELRQDGEIGRLAIQKFGGHQTQLNDVIAWIERVEDKWNDSIDVLVIDYADKLAGNPSIGMYEQMREVYEGIRLFCVERHIWGWTASQTKRVADGVVPSMNDGADSQHKIRVTDMAIGMARDPSDGNKISVKIVANRNGDEGAEVGPLANGFAYGVLTEGVARPDLVVADALVPDIDKGIFD